MTAMEFEQPNNKQPPDVALLMAHGVRSRCEHARAMGNDRKQPGGVSIYDAHEVRE